MKNKVGQVGLCKCGLIFNYLWVVLRERLSDSNCVCREEEERRSVYT